MQLLDINNDSLSLAYYRVVTTLKLNGVLSTTIAAGGWRTYTDGDSDEALGEDSLPSLETMPFSAGAAPEGVTAQYENLGIGISIACEGTDARDLLNLWGAVRKALFPGDGAASLKAAIRADFQAMVPPSGAQIEDVQLTAGAITPKMTAANIQTMAASGTITLVMRVRK